MKSRYLSLTPFIAWRQAERPMQWHRRFGRQAPLEVEIGFGNGEFLVRQAQAAPHRLFVGIELEWSSVQRGLRRLAQAGIDNVRLLQADVRVVLERLFRPQSIDRVSALFPCPWPKERHAKHRLFSHAFLQLLNSRLRPDGELQIITDHQPYVRWILTQVANTGFTAQSQQVPAGFHTKYERKWQAQGQQRFVELRLRKSTHISVPLHEDVALQTHRVAVFDPSQFSPANARGDIAITFKDFLFDPKQQRGMVWVFVTEGHLQQNFWIEIARGKEHWTIRPARGCAMVHTAGVQRALDLVRDATHDGQPGGEGQRHAH
ncbi:tRNA (guanine-N(7)-)-methyltransferase [Candidatus Entotheonellaceae bacterium PAL068K]